MSYARQALGTRPCRRRYDMLRINSLRMQSSLFITLRKVLSLQPDSTTSAFNSLRMQTSQFTILPVEKIRELYSSLEQAKASDREMKGTVENILEVIFQENCRACTHQATSSKNDLGIRGPPSRRKRRQREYEDNILKPSPSKSNSNLFGHRRKQKVMNCELPTRLGGESKNRHHQCHGAARDTLPRVVALRHSLEAIGC